MLTKIPIAKRFWAKVRRSTPRKCWIWKAGTDGEGYPKIGEGGRHGRTLRASRVCWKITHGRDPGKRLICHTCDNKVCVNPNHLYLGTSQSNMDDRTARGRMPIGSRCYNARLTERQVRLIKATRGLRRFHASRSTVSHILAGRQWKHVK